MNRFPNYLHGCSHKVIIQNGGAGRDHTPMLILETAENMATHILSLYHILPSKHPWPGACNVWAKSRGWAHEEAICMCTGNPPNLRNGGRHLHGDGHVLRTVQ